MFISVKTSSKEKGMITLTHAALSFEAFIQQSVTPHKSMAFIVRIS